MYLQGKTTGQEGRDSSFTPPTGLLLDVFNWTQHVCVSHSLKPLKQPVCVCVSKGNQLPQPRHRKKQQTERPSDILLKCQETGV